MSESQLWSDFGLCFLCITVKNSYLAQTYLRQSLWWLSSKEASCDAGNMGSVPGLGRSPGGGNGNPLKDPCLGNPMARAIWRAAVPGVSRVRHDLAAQPPPLKINAVSHHSGLYRSVLSPPWGRRDFSSGPAYRPLLWSVHRLFFLLWKW